MATWLAILIGITTAQAGGFEGLFRPWRGTRERFSLKTANANSATAPTAVCSSGKTPSARRVAWLLGYFGNHRNEESDVRGTLSRLRQGLEAQGYRVQEAENATPETLRGRLQWDRAQHPRDYAANAPLVVFHSVTEDPEAGTEHFLVSQRDTTEWPSHLDPHDSVTPSTPSPNALYRILRRTSTRALMETFQGALKGVKMNFILASPLADRARNSLPLALKRSLASLTVPNRTQGTRALFARLVTALQNPRGFDLNRDGQVSNEELFPQGAPTPMAATVSAPHSDPEIRRPQPQPVPLVLTEGRGVVVGEGC